MRPFIPSSILNSETTEEAELEKTKAVPVYRRLLRLRSLSPLVFYTVVFLLLGHLAVATVMPLFVPEELYLYLYLGKDARESTKNFLAGNHPFLIYDNTLGWRNRPNVRQDKWMTDEYGARTTHRASNDSSRKKIVMFLGNSLINGGTNVSNDETISAFIEDASTESINLATMLYALDQIYLNYKEREYKADVVVVGLPSEPAAGLLNQYVPFRVKFENKMPFFKPRFEIRSGELSILSVPPLKTYEKLLDNSDILKTLMKTDAYYNEFSRYKRFGLMPVSSAIYSLYERIRHYAQLIWGNAEGMSLLKTLIKQMVFEARARNASIVFMALPNLKTVAPGIFHRYLPDLYGKMVNELKEEGYPILDVRPALRQSGIPPQELFDADGVHFSSAGNRVIAAALKNAIEHLR